MVDLMRDFLREFNGILHIQPNAGTPQLRDGEFVYSCSPADFARDMLTISQLGARAVGGCCGTTPDHIRTLHDLIQSCEQGT